jgi:glycerophosphoryl diester phosphodiesterase
MPELKLRRVGHKGADRIAPGNTLASFDAALAAGVDMIEFDVLPDRREPGRLILAHDYEDAESRTPYTLAEGLAHLSSEQFTGIELDVDLKLPGYEQPVIDALHAHGVAERALVCSQFRESLEALRRIDPSIRVGWSVPKLRRDPFRHPAIAVPAYALLIGMRAGLPLRAARAISERRCDALMAHWRLVTPRLVRAVHSAGGELYVWTVDELPQIRKLEALGVNGVITNDPRLFTALGPAQA